MLDTYDPCEHIPPDISDRDCISDQVRRRFEDRLERFKLKAIDEFEGEDSTE